MARYSTIADQKLSIISPWVNFSALFPPCCCGMPPFSPFGVQSRLATSDLTLYHEPHAEKFGKALTYPLINAGSAPATLQVLAIGDIGQPLQASGIHNAVSIMLQPGQQILTGIDTLLHLPASATDPKLTSGSLFITGQTSGLIGDLVFGDADSGRFVSGLNLTQDTTAKGLFAQLAEGPSGTPSVNFFTGVGFFNPGPAEATIELQAFSPNGVRLRSVFVVLGPRERISQTIGQWMPLVGPIQSGYLRFEVSGSEVASFAVFGDRLLNFLAAIPPFPMR